MPTTHLHRVSFVRVVPTPRLHELCMFSGRCNLVSPSVMWKYYELTLLIHLFSYFNLTHDDLASCTWSGEDSFVIWQVEAGTSARIGTAWTLPRAGDRPSARVGISVHRWRL